MKKKLFESSEDAIADAIGRIQMKDKPVVCPEHLKEIAIFCTECRQFGCKVCETEAHLGHNLDDVRDAAKNVLQELEQFFNPNFIKEKLSSRIDLVQAKLEAMTEVSSNYQRYFEQMLL